MAAEKELPSLALTIAGFDPSGGAGILADTRTFVTFGFIPSAAITSITFQNRERVFGASHQTGEEVRAQVMPLLEDRAIACAKTGMLPTRDVVQEVARLFRENRLPAPVVDPVMVSTSGQRLMEDEALEALVDELLPLACLVTPNILEAERLTGMQISSEEQMERAAAKIRELGTRAVLIKGGHLRSQEAAATSQYAGSQEAENQGSHEMEARSLEAIDVLDNEGQITVFRERRVPHVELHGTGCILSAAIAAGLGRKMCLEEAVGAAKSFVLAEIGRAASA